MRRHPCGQSSGRAVDVIQCVRYTAHISFLHESDDTERVQLNAGWKNLFLPVGQL